MEEAAASLGAGRFTIFRRIVFPNLLPAILSGVALAFARAVGEFGSVVLISGNIPFKTEVASVYIFGQHRERRPRGRGRRLGGPARHLASSRSLAIGAVRRWATRHDGELGTASASARSATWRCCSCSRSGMVFYRAVRARLRRRLGRRHDARRAARALADRARSPLIAVPAEHGLRRSSARSCSCAQRFRGKGVLNALIDLPLALSPVVVGLALLLVYGRARLVRPVARRPRHPGRSSRCRAWCWRRSSSRCRSSCARSSPCCARSAPSRSRPRRRSARRVADLPPHHAAGDPLGRRLRRRPDDGARLGEFGAVAVVSGQHRGQDRDADAVRRAPVPGVRHRRAPTRPRSCSRCCAS